MLRFLYEDLIDKHKIWRYVSSDFDIVKSLTDEFECDLDCILENTLSIEIGRYLLTKGANPKSLHTACFRGNIEMVRFLLDNGYNDDKDEWNIIYAIYADNIYIVKLFVEELGYDITTGNVFCEACKYGRIEILKYLILQGCNPEMYHNDPMIEACRYNQLETVKFLISQGIDIFDDIYLSDLLSNSVEIMDSYDVVRFLLEIGVRESVDLAMLNCVAKGYFKTMKLLVIHGASDFHDAFNYALRYDKKEIINYLTNNHLDKISLDDLLWNYSQYKSPKITLLLSLGADINKVLVTACEHRYLDVISFLVSYGADLRYPEAKILIDETPVLKCFR